MRDDDTLVSVHGSRHLRTLRVARTYQPVLHLSITDSGTVIIRRANDERAMARVSANGKVSRSMDVDRNLVDRMVAAFRADRQDTMTGLAAQFVKRHRRLVFTDALV